MSSHSLYWGDGLFLRPHHFQCLETEFHDALRRSEAWTTPAYYGLHQFEQDPDALANWRISLSRCHVRLMDGTQLRFPEDCHISPEVIPRSVFRNAESRVRIYLGISELRKGASNTGAGSDSPPPRYVQHRQEVEDENRPGNPQEIEFRRANPRILIGDEAARGFDAVPLMQLKLGATAEAPPQIDPDYIPPVLCQEAWPQVSSFVRSVYDRLSATAEQLSRQMIDRGVAFGSGHREDFERILHLHALNTALGSVAPLPFTRGVHPFVIYTELCRAAGCLAIFRRERKISELPSYNHDNIAYCFRELRKLLDIEMGADAEYVRIAFAWQGLQMSVRLQSEWLEPDWAFYIGVESTLSGTRVTELLSERKLDLKAGSSDEVDDIYRRGRRGVRIVPATETPRVFPRQNWHYFRVDRNEAWTNVERTLNLGIRFNEQMVEKQSNAANSVDVEDRDTGNLVTLAFSLFAIRASAS
ncbi:MAG: type VI secretion system baseplate subunit TssK [Planctomycetaceae bacterium]|nr:type VI secretion system baseplate subunit TssK [Planctomycetaceae bacterium]